MDYLISEFAFLKLVHLRVVCHSLYPYLSWYEYGPLAEEVKLFDDIFRQSNLDVIFKGCNHKVLKGEKKTGLIRAEFIESVVRIAKHKYFDTDIAVNMKDACKILVD